MEYIEEFFDTFKLGNPVMLHWYYDGYYEDFSWESNEVSIPPILLEEYGIEFDREEVAEFILMTYEEIL